MRALLLTLTTCLLVLPAYAKYSGGSGTAADPYQIATATDLIALGDEPNDYDKHFILTADIDLDPNLPGRKLFDRAVIAPDTGTTKGDFQGTAFTGVFDGDGHTISHLTITGGNYLGLFGQLGDSRRVPARAEVRNLGVIDVNITGSDDCVGGLAGSDGYNHQGGQGVEIVNCYSSGVVSGISDVGGLVGSNGDWFGQGGVIMNCYSSGVVGGVSCVGGLVGTNTGGSMTQCYSTAAVSADGNAVGGLVGSNCWDYGGGTVTQCYSTGPVTGGSFVGGLAGEIWSGGSVTQCYSTGSVSGTENVGGLVGSLFWPACQVGDCFWDTQTSGQATSAGGTGKTTAEMQTAKTFLDAGWDFVGETANGTDDIWKIVEGLTYPLLSWQKYSGGTGEPNDPYQIATAADLIALGETPEDYGKHFIVTADIDLDPNLPGRKVFDKAVIAPATFVCGKTLCFPTGARFTGVFDGNGHAISHITITGKEYLGLFGQLGSWDPPTGKVRNLGVVDVNITGTGDSVGGLVGMNMGAITGCYSTGAVSGTGSVGGLVGVNGWGDENAQPGDVNHCYSIAAVSGTGAVGGLVGYNAYGPVTDCYSAGAVTGAQAVGGLVGQNSGQVTQCYSAGAVDGDQSVGGLAGSNWAGTVTACFWDTQTSGQPISDGGTGLTTVEMQMAKTFLDAGWDFVNETANGTEDIWWIDEGKDYPRLWWEAK